MPPARSLAGELLAALRGCPSSLGAQRRLVAAGTALFASVVAMVVLRHRIRLVRLGDELVRPPVRPQWAAIALLAVSFVVAIAVIAWMIRLYRRRPAG